ncbi:MAG: dienelactone hydrolase family protein [Candidatus Eremiobacteraeota bacterium]|nr:dienelactone hydrolase family protein [Candidatus Eremiobacteraeota bacterium]
MRAEEIDPTQTTSERLNRRVFVGLSAAATVAAAAAAGAQEEVGRPHPPAVAENDPAIVVDRLSLESSGSAVPAYASWPVSAGPGTPGVVVIMHIWGVDTPIRDFVRRLAKSGFAAIAPDLYARMGAPSGDGASDYTIFRPYAQRLERDVWLSDVRSAAQWLAAKFSGTKIAITGFCMGGKLALLAAVEEGNLFSVVAPFYGAVADVDPKAIRIPVCGSYGGRDTGIPAQSVRLFADALRVPNDIRIYDDAGHAFFDDQRASYVGQAAADAWKRTVACFRRYLSGASQ